MKTLKLESEIQADETPSTQSQLTLNVNDYIEVDPVEVNTEDEDDGDGDDEGGEPSFLEFLVGEATQQPFDTDSTPPLSPLLEPLVYLSNIVEKVWILIRATHIGKRRQQIYKKLCNEEKVNSNVLQLDCPTRWSSTYMMLDAALDKRCVLDKGVSEFKTKGKETRISDEEWTILQIFVEILQPFAFGMQSVSSSRHQTITDILTMVEVLMKHLTDIEIRHRRAMLFNGANNLDSGDQSSILTACRQMKSKFEEYRQRLTDNQVITSVAVLDPHHKGKSLSESVRSKAIAYIKSLLPESAPPSSTPSSPSTKRAKMTRRDWFQSNIRRSENLESQSLTPVEQLDKFLEEAASKDGSSVISWWTHIIHATYPTLAPVARELLCISVTSAPAERLFFAAREIVNYKRNWLTAQSIETLVMVKCWLRGHTRAWYDVVLDEDIDEDE